MVAREDNRFGQPGQDTIGPAASGLGRVWASVLDGQRFVQGNAKQPLVEEVH